MKPRGCVHAMPLLLYFGKPRLNNNTACFDNPTDPASAGLARLSKGGKAHPAGPVSLSRLRLRLHRARLSAYLRGGAGPRKHAWSVQ